MYLDTCKIRSGNKVYTRVLLRESYREDGKVKHRTIANSPTFAITVRPFAVHRSPLAWRGRCSPFGVHLFAVQGSPWCAGSNPCLLRFAKLDAFNRCLHLAWLSQHRTEHGFLRSAPPFAVHRSPFRCSPFGGARGMVRVIIIAGSIPMLLQRVWISLGANWLPDITSQMTQSNHQLQQ